MAPVPSGSGGQCIAGHAIVIIVVSMRGIEHGRERYEVR